MNQIVDSPTVWQVFQLITAFAQSACSVARDEIPAALKIKLTTQEVKASRAVMVEEAMKLLEELDTKARHFYAFIGHMQDIAMLLEEQKFALRHIRTLRRHAVVIDALKKLQEKYANELKAV